MYCCGDRSEAKGWRRPDVATIDVVHRGSGCRPLPPAFHSRADCAGRADQDRGPAVDEGPRSSVRLGRDSRLGGLVSEPRRVDAIGNLQDAIQSAADKAGLTDYDVIFVEQQLTAREQMIIWLNQFLTAVFNPTRLQSAHPLAGYYEKFAAELNQLAQLNDPRGVYAYCLACDVH